MSNHSEPELLRQQEAKALFNKGMILSYKLNRFEESIGVFEELVRHYGDDTSPSVREWVARALFNKAVIFGQLNRPGEKIEVYDELVQCYGDDTFPSIRGRVAKALFNKGLTLGQLNRFEESTGVYEELVQRYGYDASSSVREVVAIARSILNNLKRHPVDGSRLPNSRTAS